MCSGSESKKMETYSIWVYKTRRILVSRRDLHISKYPEVGGVGVVGGRGVGGVGSVGRAARVLRRTDRGVLR